MQLPEINVEILLKLLLNQYWHQECKIIPDYMPPYPRKDTRPKVVVMFPNEHGDTFLRYSCGPAQGFFWDVYGDNMQSVELAVFALSKAPIPLNYRRLESHIKFQLKPKNQEAPSMAQEARQENKE